jgi:hypothetical protein
MRSANVNSCVTSVSQSKLSRVCLPNDRQAPASSASGADGLSTPVAPSRDAAPQPSAFQGRATPSSAIAAASRSPPCGCLECHRNGSGGRQRFGAQETSRDRLSRAFFIHGSIILYRRGSDRPKPPATAPIATACQKRPRPRASLRSRLRRTAACLLSTRRARREVGRVKQTLTLLQTWIFASNRGGVYVAFIRSLASPYRFLIPS